MPVRVHRQLGDARSVNSTVTVLSVHIQKTEPWLLETHPMKAAKHITLPPAMKYTAAVAALLMRCANTAGRCWPACQCVSAATAKSTEMAMEPSVFSRSTFASWNRPAHVAQMIRVYANAANILSMPQHATSIMLSSRVCRGHESVVTMHLCGCRSRAALGAPHFQSWACGHEHDARPLGPLLSLRRPG